MAKQKTTEELITPQDLTFEESEESSDNDMAMVSQLWRNEPSISKGTDIEELTPAVSEDCHHITQGPIMSEDCCCAMKGTAADEDSHCVMHGPTASEDCHRIMHGVIDLTNEYSSSDDEEH